MIFDSHAHYDDEEFDIDREKIIKEVNENGVIGILNCGSSLKGARMSVELANKFEFMFAAVGIHPEQANEFNEDVLNELREMALNNKKVRAIGEIGLDYYWDENPSKDIQTEIFRKQMQLAGELNLPVVIHDREAHKDTLDIIKEYPDVRGVVHCFSGSVDFARECLKAGYYIGITGVITFKNAKKILEVAKEIPMERLLVETDCPYMAPVPNRGKRNKSDYIEFVIEKIAEVKGVSNEEIENATIKNAKRFLKV